MNAAEEIRTAADHLDALLAAVPAGTWSLHEDLLPSGGTAESAVLTDGRDGMDALVLSGDWDRDALAAIRLLVALRGVAGPLVASLRVAADHVEQFAPASALGYGRDTSAALAVARAINASLAPSAPLPSVSL